MKSERYLNQELFLDDLADLKDTNRFCFILGSGASFSSGIPTGLKMMEGWREYLMQRSDSNMKERCKRAKCPYDKWNALRQPGYQYESEDYFTLYDLRYGGTPEAGKKYLKNAMKGKKPSSGYYRLAELMSRTKHNVVITTNFDSLAEKAFILKDIDEPQTVSDPAQVQHIRAGAEDTPLIAKVHGDLMLNPLNFSWQLRDLPKEWKEKLRELFLLYTPIVIGYAGGDRTLMRFLKGLDFPRVYWCSMKEREGDTIETFLNNGGEKQERRHVQISGFDGIMEQIYTCLMGEQPQREEKNVQPPQKSTSQPPPAPKQTEKEPPPPEPPSELLSKDDIRRIIEEQLDSVTEEQKPEPAKKTKKPLSTLSRKKFRDAFCVWRDYSYFPKYIVGKIIFQNTLSGAPLNAIGCSEERHWDVLVWLDRTTLYIAGEGGIAAPKNCRQMFENWDKLREIIGAQYFDTAKVTDMQGMFHNCASLTSLDVSRWNTTKVTDMRGMFAGCTRLTSLNVSGWDTAWVRNMYHMFTDCISLHTLNGIEHWNTSSVTDKIGMFRNTPFASHPPI